MYISVSGYTAYSAEPNVSGQLRRQIFRVELGSHVLTVVSRPMAQETSDVDYAPSRVGVALPTLRTLCRCGEYQELLGDTATDQFLVSQLNVLDSSFVAACYVQKLGKRVESGPWQCPEGGLV